MQNQMLTHKLCNFSAILAMAACLAGSALEAATGPVSITNQPMSQVVLQDSPVTFTVGADGTQPFTYQWRLNGALISGGTASSYSIASAQPANDFAQFSVIVSNSFGAVTSAVAVLRVDPGVAGTTVTGTNLIDMASKVWKYYQSGDLGSTWLSPTFDDSAWPSGTAMFGYETTPTEYPLAFNSPLPAPASGGPITVYFRTHFTFNGSPDLATLTASNLLDDGAVFYLNGQYVGAVRVAEAPNQVYSTVAANQPAEGVYDVLTLSTAYLNNGDNVLEVELHDSSATSSDKVFGMSLYAAVTNRVADTTAPTIERILPPSGPLPVLNEIEVVFTKPVINVDASDLLINGQPATNLLTASSRQYIFQFSQPPTGTVMVTWAANHGICDLGVVPNAFAGDGWSYFLDPNASAPIYINEFLADNKNGYPNAKRDIDGDFSDWLELYNSDPDTMNLQGWFLTDDPTDLTKWTFPAASIQGNKYLLVWCSGKTNVVGQLHTSFKLSAAGGYLALVNPATNIIAQITAYPPQSAGVSYGLWPGTTTNYTFFTTPTPEAANSISGGAAGSMAPPVTFSSDSKTYVSNFPLVLSTTNPAAAIYYTTTTNMPTTNMTLYTGPITLSNTVLIRARAFLPGMLPGEVHSESYIKLDTATVFAGFTNTAANFNSDLPVVVFHNYGGGPIPAGATKGGYSQFAMIQLFEPTYGRSYLSNAPSLTTLGTIHRRGAATLDLPKSNLRVEFQGEYKEPRSLDLLGMPSDNDWVFYAVNGYDKVLMHNPLAHELYRQMGHWTPRTRFVEVFIKKDSTIGPLTATDYQGLYVLEEKIKINKNRVDIDQMTPQNTNAATVTGGYLFSVDKTGVGAQFTGANQAFWYLDPEAAAIVPAQSSYLINYLNNSYNTFSATTGTNFANWIDAPGWIDNHLHNTMVNNADMFRISAYWTKARNGKWAPACLWDFDRGFAMYAQDGDQRGYNPLRWHSGYGDKGTDPFNADGDGGYANPWFSKLFLNIDWYQLWIDRYQELRATIYSSSNVTAVINNYATQVNEATAREYAKAAVAWPGTSSDTRPNAGTVTGDGFTYTFPTPGTWQGEQQWVRVWFTNRLNFIDTNFLDRPSLSRPEGAVIPGSSLTISPASKAGSSVYYTLDGTDPRLPGGGINPAALSSVGPITLPINSNMRVCARSRNPNHSNLTGAHNPPLNSVWSGPVYSTYAVATPTLAVTEIMYHYGGGTGTNLEYVELKNTGATPLNLRGFQFTNGISYLFPANLPLLQPGAYIVVASSVAGFSARYPGITNVVGNYSGSLNNGGERLTLVGPYLEPVLNFSFNNAWYPMTDGNGFSLVVVNEGAPFNTWTNAASWRPSALEGGSPGATDPQPAVISPVYINEVVANPSGMNPDQIELYNPNAFPVDVGNWYLSDDFGTPKKFRIPSPTLIPAFGYKVFTSSDFDNPPGATNSFGLGARGDNAYLFSGNTNGLLTGYYHGFAFGPSPLGASFGRYVTSIGEEKFVLETTPTLGTNNSAPLISPIVISEIMYSPQPYAVGTNFVQNPDEEYVELYNPGPQPAPLYDTAHATNTWKLRDAVSYTFPQNVTLPAGGYLLVVNFDPQANTNALASFKARFNITNGLPIYGPWSGQLDNVSDKVELVRPDEPVLPAGSAIYVAPEILMDKVAYENTTPWPCGADATGNSLQRLSAGQFGNDPINWVADLPTPGKATIIKPAGLATIVAQPAPLVVAEGAIARFSVSVCGLPPFFYQWKFNGNALPAATNASYQIASAQLGHAGAYSVVVSNLSGMVTSLDAGLIVQQPPGIAQQPQSQTVLGYTTATLGVTPTGIPPFRYQWRFEGNDLLDATNQYLVLTNILGGQAGDYNVTVSTAAGYLVSSNATLTINLPAKIWTQPVSIKVSATSNATFTVGANGFGTLAYQWFKDNQIIPDATNSTLVVSNVSLASDAMYSVAVSNVFGADLSQPVRLQVMLIPYYTVKPLSQTVLLGGDGLLNASVVGSLPMRTRWEIVSRSFYNYTSYEQNLTTVPIHNAQLVDGGLWRVVTTNEAWTSGSTFNFYVAVVVPPQNVMALEGSNTTLRVVANGIALKYQWMYNGTNLVNGGNISGATTANLLLSKVTASQAGTYTVAITNGTTANNIVGTFHPVTLTVQSAPVAPQIVDQPVSCTAVTNGNATLLVRASGTDPLRFQWFFNSTNLVTSGTNTFLSITNLQGTNAGFYQVVVSNMAGVVTSDVAQLTLAAPPVITHQPDGLTVPSGAEIGFTVAATGTAPLAYQWYFNLTNAIAGATNASLNFSSVTSADAGTYHVVVSNGVGTAISDVAILTISGSGNTPPSITQSPASIITNTGARISLVVGASGDGPLTYQWYFNGVAVSNASASTFTLASAQATDSGSYYATVSNASGSRTSQVATVMVVNPALDTDHDGMSDLRELLAGTNPNDANSVLKLTLTPAAPNGQSALQFNAASNHSYTVQYLDFLSTSNWLRLQDFPAAPTNRQVGLTNNLLGPSRYYRIATPLLP